MGNNNWIFFECSANSFDDFTNFMHLIEINFDNKKVNWMKISILALKKWKFSDNAMHKTNIIQIKNSFLCNFKFCNAFIWNSMQFSSLSVPPMLMIMNQLVGSAVGQKITLECQSEAFPKSINYWMKNETIITRGKQIGIDYVMSVRCLEGFLHRNNNTWACVDDVGSFWLDLMINKSRMWETKNIQKIPRSIFRMCNDWKLQRSMKWAQKFVIQGQFPRDL